MVGLLAAELLKLRKRWMVRILGIVLILICALIFWGLGTTHNRSDLFFPRGLLVGAIFATTVGTFLWPILAASWAGNEYGWGTIRMILSRRPERVEYLVASVGVLVIAAGLGVIAVLIVELIAGAITASATGNNFVDSAGLGSSFGVDVIKAYLAAWYTTLFFIVLAYAAATVFRSGGVGIGIGIGFTVGQIIISGIFMALGGPWKTVEEHLPRAYSDVPSMIGNAYLKTNFANHSGSGPGIGGGTLGLTVYVVALLVVTIAFVLKRDVTD